jgi:hypothetical protein
MPWFLILKIVHTLDDPLLGGTADPADANYWKREVLIYRSGILEELPGVRAPRCFGVDELDGTDLLWLEDVRDSVGSGWAPALYRLAARRVGEFNGALPRGRKVPTAPFLSRGWLRTPVSGFEPALAKLPLLRAHSMVRRCWPDGLVDRLLHLGQGNASSPTELLPEALQARRDPSQNRARVAIAGPETPRR